MATKPSSLPVWATSAGSTIIGSLTATDATFISTVTRGAVYGRIRYTFSGSPSFASVLVGYKLTVTGMTDALNNVTNAEIYSVDDSADTIDILITSRLDASADETGASGTGTVTDAGALIQAPSSARQALGHLAPQLPGDGYENWYKNLVYQWCNYLNDFVAGAIEVNQAHTFVVGDVVYVNSGTWADARGNAIATSTNCYLVIEVTDSSNFTVAKEGRRTWTAHGLTANTTYYLDPDTAAGLVATKPIGNTSRPLGYYLPVLRVVDSNTVDLVIPVEPVFNPIYARYKPTSSSAADFTFTNLSLTNVGSGVRMRGGISGDGAGGTSIEFTVNGTSSGYNGVFGYPNSESPTSSWTIDKTNTTAVRVAEEHNSDNRDLGFNGELNYAGSDWVYCGKGITDYVQAYDFWGITPSATNITSIEFNITNLQFDGTYDFVDLIISQMPEA